VRRVGREIILATSQNEETQAPTHILSACYGDLGTRPAMAQFGGYGLAYSKSSFLGEGSGNAR
jgi:hypothetical protein